MCPLQVMTLSAQERAVYDTVIAVLHMREGDKALFSPRMVLKVLAFKVNNWWKQITAGGKEKTPEGGETAVI